VRVRVALVPLLLAVAACGAPTATPGNQTAAAPAVDAAVTVAGGAVTGVGPRLDVPLGATLRLTVRSDAADELHVHGYDRSLDLAPGAPALLELTADVPGVFEVELHDAGTVVTSLRVR
jgi:hypothetical protein